MEILNLDKSGRNFGSQLCLHRQSNLIGGRLGGIKNRVCVEDFGVQKCSIWSGLGTTLAASGQVWGPKDGLGTPRSILRQFQRLLGGLEEVIGRHFGGRWLTCSCFLCLKFDQIPGPASLVVLEASVISKSSVFHT